MIIDKINAILKYTAMNNSVYEYFKMLIALLLSLTILLIIKKILLVKIAKWTKKTNTDIDDFIVKSLKKFLLPVLYFISFYISVQHLKLHTFITNGLTIIGYTICIVSATRFLLAMIFFVIEKHNINYTNKPNTALTAIKTLIKILFWSIALIIFLDNMGIRITGLIAGLGISGVAVAFASQAILQDILSYFTIFADRPFEIGDYIIIDDFQGEIEHIGIKTTRIKSLSGEQLIFSNNDLTKSRLRNFKRMKERRVAFTFGVVYETSTEILKEIPQLAQQIIDKVDNARFDRCHFFKYGDFSLIFETVYYVNTNNYTTFMDVQQSINLEIKQAFENSSIQFAYPTQVIYINK